MQNKLRIFAPRFLRKKLLKSFYAKTCVADYRAADSKQAPFIERDCRKKVINLIFKVMSNNQNLNEKQKEDLKEVFEGMKLSIKESERIAGGGDIHADLCILSKCNPLCNIDNCVGCVMCPVNGVFQCDPSCESCIGFQTFGSIGAVNK